MIPKENSIKKAVSGISLTDREKERILAGCEECAAGENNRKKAAFSLKRATAVLCAVMLLVGGTVGTFAAKKLLPVPDAKNKSHTENVTGDIVVGQDSSVLSEDGKYILHCTAFAGGGDKVYAGLSLEKADGGEFLDLGENESVVNVGLGDTYIDGSNGQQYYMYGLPVDSVYEDRLAFEAFSVIEEKLPEKTDIYVGGLTVTTAKTEKYELNGTLLDVLSGINEGKAEKTDSTEYFYDGDLIGSGDSYLLGAGSGKIRLCNGREIYIDNYCFAPYGDFYSGIGRQYNALYLSVIPDEGMKTGGEELQFECPGTEYIIQPTSDSSGRINVIVIGRSTAPDGSKETRDITEKDISAVTVATLKKFETKKLCGFDKTMSVSTDYKDIIRNESFDPVVLHTKEADITLSRMTASNTTLDLYGKTDTVGKLYELDEICDTAYAVLSDGSKVELGSKGCAGTTPDGELQIEWLLKTVIDTEKICEIHIGDATVRLK